MNVVVNASTRWTWLIILLAVMLALALLVAIHVEEALESALAAGGELRSMGVRRNRLTRQPEWFAERTEGEAGPAGPGPLRVAS